MRPLILFIIPAAVFIMSADGGRITKLTWKAKVDGSTFRITRDEQGIVNVVDKALVTGRTMAVRDKMRIAVRQATGCELTDELWFDAKLKGKLSCPAGQEPKSPSH